MALAIALTILDILICIYFTVSFGVYALLVVHDRWNWSEYIWLSLLWPWALYELWGED